MPPAVIAAGVGAAGAIGGSLISSGAQHSAANEAANATTQASNQATQAQLQLGQQSLGQQRDIYNSNFNILSPYASRGNVAGEAINALLGLPQAPAMQAPLSTSSSQAPAQSGPTMAQIAAMQHDGIPGNYRAALAQMGAQPSGGGGIPALVSPVGALLTGGGLI